MAWEPDISKANFARWTRQGDGRLAMRARSCYFQITGGRMTTTTFDSLGYFEKLKAVGVPEEQAKVQANALRELIDERLATKQDLRELETRLDNKIEKLEYRLTIRLGGMMAASIAIVAALVKLT
jgi:hypothetical protein